MSYIELRPAYVSKSVFLHALCHHINGPTFDVADWCKGDVDALRANANAVESLLGLHRLPEPNQKDEIDRLKAELAAKDKEIDRLKAELAVKDEKIEQLKRPDGHHNVEQFYDSDQSDVTEALESLAEPGNKPLDEFAASQYCQICGLTLDGYSPSKTTEEAMSKALQLVNNLRAELAAKEEEIQRLKETQCEG